MEYITKKVPKNLSGRIRRLKALMSLRMKRKVTEGEVIALGIAKLEEGEERRSRNALIELSGIIKNGKSSSKEVDDVVYG